MQASVKHEAVTGKYVVKEIRVFIWGCIYSMMRYMKFSVIVMFASQVARSSAESSRENRFVSSPTQEPKG